MLLIRISGDVIGVGFRALTYRYAQELNLKGYVRNMPDATVEIGLDSEKAQADLLVKKLKQAGFTHIDSVTITKQPGSLGASGFKIR